ncbi:MAG: cytoplasmic protein [Neisseriales bacterium]|jgi:uncharacterized protein (DUF4415 family)|nr:MAG: cytoplasmic protein [Neisseriales bacterium]
MKTKNREEQLTYLRNLKDEDIDYSDDYEITDDEISLIRPNPLFYKPVKKKVSFTLDMDIISWLHRHKNVSGFLNELLKKEILKHA